MGKADSIMCSFVASESNCNQHQFSAQGIKYTGVWISSVSKYQMIFAHKYILWKESVFSPFISTKSPPALICTSFQAMPRSMIHHKYELQTCLPSYASRCLSFMCQICSFKILPLTFQKSTSFPCCALWWRKSTAFGRHGTEKNWAISNQKFYQNSTFVRVQQQKLAKWQQWPAKIW